MTTHHQRTYDTVGALFATLVAHGVSDVVVSPGSRSTPLAVAADATTGVNVHVVLDERSAGFTALGMSTVSGRPTGLICTSGSATANYLPAVVEAGRGRVPLVVLTADRPDGFLDRDASQTVDQIGLYGVHVRSSVSLPTAHEADPADVQVLVRAALSEASSPDAGPVHINCPFDKPLEPEPGWRPPEAVPEQSLPIADAADPAEAAALGELLAASERPLILAGPRRAPVEELEALNALGIPIIADPLSGHRRHPDAITTGELLFRTGSVDELKSPDLLIRTGGIPAGRATQQWLEAVETQVVIIDPDLRWTATGPETVLRSSPGPLALAVTPPSVDSAWLEAWREAEASIVALRGSEISEHPGSEVSLTATALASAPGPVWAASSMPVRHLDVMAPAGTTARLLSNRGANGIDGTIASAAGAAKASGERVTVILGDLAFLHDIGSLKTASDLGVDVTIVVLDNGGGAIFSMLPIAGNADVEFDRLFFTPHNADLVAIARGFGVESRAVDASELGSAVAESGGVEVMVVRCDPTDTHAAYARMVRG